MTAVTWASMAITLGINVVICAILFSIFNILRNKESTKKFYAPKRFLSIPFRHRPRKLPNSFLGWFKPLMSASDDEVYAVAGMDALTYIRYLSLGLKLTVTIGVLCLAVLLPVHYFAGTVVDDCNAKTGPIPEGECDKDTYTNFDKATLSNIENESSLLWVHAALMYIITFMVLSALWLAQKQAMQWRVRYLAETRKGAESHSILVQNIPGISYGTLDNRTGKDKVPGANKVKLGDKGSHSENLDVYLSTNPHPPTQQSEQRKSTANVSLVQKCSLDYLQKGEVATDFDTWGQAENALSQGISLTEVVKREFERTYPDGEVESVTVVKDVSKLGPMLNTYESTKTKVLDTIDGWVGKMRAGKPIKPATQRIFPIAMGEAGQAKWGSAPSATVDKDEYTEWDLQNQFDEIKKEQGVANSKDTCSAFVTFRSRISQSQAATSLHYHNEQYWTNEAAPGPREIHWKNLSFRGWERSVRFVLTWIMFAVFTCFFFIPVALVQGLMNVDQLREDWAPIDWILKIQFFNSLISGILPGLALTIFLALVPMFLKMMNNFQGIYSNSKNDFEVAKKYFIFQFLIVFLGSIVGGTLLNSIDALKDDPKQWFDDLGAIIPTTASFFLGFILVQALFTIPLGKLLRAIPLVIYFIKCKLVGSERAKKRLWSKQMVSYGTLVPPASLVYVYLFVYCVQQPLIVIPCAIYFTVVGIIGKYNLMYVQREPYQSGGKMWPVMFNHIFFALVIFQVFMIVILGLKKFPYAVILIIPIIVCIIFRMNVSATFDRPLENLSLHAAADLDRADKNRPALTDAEEREMIATMDTSTTAVGPVRELYMHPGFKLKEQEHRDVLSELRGIISTKAAYRNGEKPSGLPAQPVEDDRDLSGRFNRDGEMV